MGLGSILYLHKNISKIDLSFTFFNPSATACSELWNALKPIEKVCEFSKLKTKSNIFPYLNFL